MFIPINAPGSRLVSVSFVCSCLLGLGVGMSEATAQILPDATLGPESSNPNPGGIVNAQPAIVIEGGVIRDANLLHSFTDFNVGVNQRVYFNHDNTVNYIIARVTGGNPSNINGTLGVSNNGITGSADLFLINPNGIIFGPNATLDLGGSFTTSTAESIIFDNGESFSTASLDVPLLTINLPVSLQFGNRAERIQIDGINTFPRLSVDLERTLALIGGDIEIRSGDVSATHGRIALGSVAPQSTVDLITVPAGWIFDYSNVSDFQDILLSQGGAVVSTGGNIQVQARNLIIEEQAYFDLSPTPAQASGSLVIETSESVQLRDNGTDLFLENGGLAQDVGFIEIRTGNLLLGPGTSIRSTTLGNGRAGDINVYAQNIDLSDSQIRSESFTREAGNINLFAQNLSLQFGSIISAATASPAAGGNITVRPLQPGVPSAITVDSLSRITTETFAAGIAGNIVLDATTIRLDNQGRITAAETTNSQGGSIRLENVGTLHLDNGSRITTEAVNGQGGTIDIAAVNGIFLNNGSRITSEATATGSAGGIRLRTAGELRLTNDSAITVSTAGTGLAGNLDVEAGSIYLQQQGRIQAFTNSGLGGNLEFRVPGNIIMRLNSEITTEALGTGDGGNIGFFVGGSILSPFLSENNDVVASAISGQGGRIYGDVRGVILFFNDFQGVRTPENDFTATSEQGLDGTVDVEFSERPEDDSLPDDFLGEEIAEGCAAGVAQSPERRHRQSTFTISGLGGVAPGVSSPLSQDNIQAPLTPWPSQDESNSSTLPSAGSQVAASEAGELAQGVAPSSVNGVNSACARGQTSS